MTDVAGIFRLLPVLALIVASLSVQADEVHSEERTTDSRESILKAIEACTNENFENALRLFTAAGVSYDDLKKAGCNFLDIPYIYHLLGKTYSGLGRNEESLEYRLRADSLMQSSGYTFFSIYVCDVLKGIAETYHSMQNWPEAEKWAARYVMNVKRFKVKDKIAEANGYLLLYRIYIQSGRLPEALAELKKYIGIAVEDKNMISGNESYLASLMLQFCELSYRLNNVDDALNVALSLETLLEEHMLGSTEHLRVCNLLFRYLSASSPDDAVVYLDKAFNIVDGYSEEKIKKSIDALTAINNYAMFISDSEPDSAMELFSWILDVLHEQGMDNNSLYAMVCNNRAVVTGLDGEGAAGQLEKSFMVASSNRLTDVTDMLLLGVNWVGSCITSRDIYGATEAAAKVQNYILGRLRDTFASLSERDRSRYWNQVRGWYQVFLPEMAVNLDYPELWKLLYDGLLQTRGILLASTVSLSRIVKESDNPLLLDLYRQYEEISGMQDADNLRAELESRIIKESKQYGNFMDAISVSSDNVSAKLEKGEVAIEFIRYDPMAYYSLFGDAMADSVAHVDTVNMSAVYYALVLKPGCKYPEAIRLCTEDELAGRNLYNLYLSVWSPIRPELVDVSRIYFSPDGKLFSLPVEYAELPDGRHIWDVWECRRLSSTREVLSEIISSGNGAALFGGMKYDMSVEDMRLDAEKYRDVTEEMVREHGFRGVISSIKPLPGTRSEVEAIRDIIAGIYNIGAGVESFMDKEATETAFKALSGRKKRLIHIATHGFFEKGEPNVSDAATMEYHDYERAAMSHSGLLFSGVDNFRYGEKDPGELDDGILDAYEISVLDLHGADLIVLSACRSGLGVVSGDGVFGLQRGLKKAGAKSILMSLWNVGDEATKFFMSEFYRNLLEDPDCAGDKHKALGKARDAVMAVPAWTDSRDWSAFILMD